MPNFATASEQKHATVASGNEPLRVVVIDRIADLAPYEEAWNKLAFESPQAVPYISYAWVVSWLETQLPSNSQWKCFVVLRGDTLVSVRPIIAVDVRFLGFRRPRLIPPTDLHTPGTDLLCNGDDCAEVVNALVPAIAKEFPKYYCFGHPRIPQDSPAVRLYQSGFRTGSPILEQLDEYAYLELGGSYDQLLERADQKFAKNVRRLERKLSNLEPKFDFYTDPEHNEACLKRFLDLEASGWKGKPGGGAIILSPRLVKFYTVLTNRLAKLGWMEWHFLEAEGKTIAAHLGVRCGNVLNLMKIAYDENYSSYSPGMVLISEMLRRAYQSKAFTAVNFQSNGRWQKNWGSESRKYYTLTVYPSRVFSLVRGYIPRRLRLAGRNMPWLMSAYHSLAKQKKREKKENE